MEPCLGTVQFGMDYGIFDTPKKSPDYCVLCLDYATQNGINAIDTATAYGMAEEIVGKFLAKRTVARDHLFISTKLKPNVLDDVPETRYADVIQENLESSLRMLHTEYVDAYFLHSSRYAFQPEILEALNTVKTRGLARHVGVSVYYPDEAEACFNSNFVDYIQAPYSIFDHRMKEKQILAASKIATGAVNIDTRTVFIKGLIRLKIHEVPPHLARAIPVLEKLDEFVEKTGYSRIDLAIGYVKREKNIKHLVFGIRDLEQLQEDIASFRKEIPEEVFKQIDEQFADIDANLVIPSLWVKKES